MPVFLAHKMNWNADKHYPVKRIHQTLLDKRTDRTLPNGLCLLPPRQACAKGNACLTCDKFATDATFLPELTSQQQRTGQLIEERRNAFMARTRQPMGEDKSKTPDAARSRTPSDASSSSWNRLASRRATPGRPWGRRRRPHRRDHPQPGWELTGMRGNPDNLRQAATQARAKKAAGDDPPRTTHHLPWPRPDRRRLSTAAPNSADALNS
ncbi:hypothetical protein [Streptomyces sp. NPDC058595]|uniref:hypothetical protein n=1 Tax=Streptomyces sp. NPDC058595 TaxID=3346550 RepID=UPI00365F6703